MEKRRRLNSGGRGEVSAGSISMGAPTGGINTLAGMQTAAMGRRIEGFQADMGNPAADTRSLQPMRSGFSSMPRLPGGSMLSSQQDLYQMYQRYDPLNAKAVETTRMTNPYIKLHHIVEEHSLSTPLEVLSREIPLFLLDITQPGTKTLMDVSEKLAKKHRVIGRKSRGGVGRPQVLFSAPRVNMIKAMDAMQTPPPSDGSPCKSLHAEFAAFSFTMVGGNDSGHDLRQRKTPLPNMEGRTTNGFWSGPANLRSSWGKAFRPGQRLWFIPRLMPVGDQLEVGLKDDPKDKVVLERVNGGKMRVPTMTTWTQELLHPDPKERARRLPPLDLLESVDDNGYVHITLGLELGRYYRTRHLSKGVAGGIDAMRNEYVTYEDAANIIAVLRPRWRRM